MSFNDFLSQERVFYKSQFFTNEEIIKFVANKLGGVHCDFKKEEKHNFLWEISKYVTFGGNPSMIQRGEIGEIHYLLEPNSVEALSGLHLEIIAASASFCNIQFNGNPVLNIQLKHTVRSRFKKILNSKKSGIYKFDLSD